MDYTTNYNLNKPTDNEKYTKDHQNSNMDIIDAKLKEHEDAINEQNVKIPILHTVEIQSIDDLDESAYHGLVICYGIINNSAYLSIDIHWIRLQFKIIADNIYIRFKYGSSGATEWKNI